MNFRVEWSIDIEADSPEQAGDRALEIQRDPNSTATVFDITGEDGAMYEYDAESQIAGTAVLECGCENANHCLHGNSPLKVKLGERRGIKR